MATKIFCDNPICNKEFLLDELFSNFMYLTASYNKQMQKQVQKNELVFCENCTKDLLKKIDEEVDKYKVAKK